MKVVRSFFSMTKAAMTTMLPRIVTITMTNRTRQTKIRVSGIGPPPTSSAEVTFSSDPFPAVVTLSVSA